MSASSSSLDRLAMTVLQPGFDGVTPPDWLRRALADGLGGAVLFARNIVDVPQTAALVAALREENPAVVVAADEEGGAVTRFEAGPGSSWPGNRALGVVDDVTRTEQVARAIGRLLAAADVTLNYAPVADVNANPANPVIGIRSFGPDPELVARHTAAWITGLQAEGVAACAKHFPGHGDTVTDSHLALPTVHASLEVLRERDLPPFRAAVEAGVQSMMCGHLLVPALDPDGPATLSRRILTGLLREELGFRGMLVTDAIEMRAVAALHPPGEVAVRALMAGADAICVGVSSPGGESVYALRDAIVAAVRDGRLPEERLAEAAARVLAVADWHTAQAATRRAAQERPGRGYAEGTDEESVEEGAEKSGEQLGLEVARAAMRVVVPGAPTTGAPTTGAPTTGTPQPVPISEPPLVVHIAPRMSRAVESGAPVGLTRELNELLPGTEGHTITAEATTLPDLSGDRPVVLVVHDAGRHAWVHELLATAVQARPDAIVVETGIPAQPVGAVYVTTHGVSRASERVVARWLTGSERTRPRQEKAEG
ncbi:glycoside hydrolase family 3 protein [Microtetraspora sp. NBRC 16547]|uniref:glycoside hydrolase family 3 protein n=1 Tax=Microtetraspora sp. NBRC 16547 TaxID=3030993 RepID=UPI0024A18273|nr:glycoside hydrolase family 3 protein [Microtetraspora sp. NBRC 16547]GLW98609.1 sugar hydrolase [Microtetraspora sp. NBRC 16547]